MDKRNFTLIILGLVTAMVIGLALRIAFMPMPSYGGVGTQYMDYLPHFGNELHPTLTPTATGTLPPLPDLEYYYYRVTYYGCPWGSPGNIMVRVRNIGQAGAGHFAVDINRLRATVEGMGAGGYRDPSVEFASGPVGGMYILVDSEGEVWESDEGNNFFSVLFTPPPPCETPEP